MKWNDDWRNDLKEKHYGCYERLSSCSNNRKDIRIIAKLMYKYNKDKGKQECIERTLEWIGDWNSQLEVADLTDEEYEYLYNYVK